MKLVIDIGNTLVKTALFKADEMIQLQSNKELTTEFLNELFNTYPEINSAIIASVRPAGIEVINLLESNTRLLQLNENTPLPFINSYKSPNTLGHDRMAAVAGASALFPGHHVLVMDAGSCITYDFITSDNRYFGGGISPGVNMRFSALNAYTAGLPLVDFDRTHQPDLIGTDTKNSILSGVQNGVLQEVDGIINTYKRQYKNLKVIMSGGDYKYFDKYLKNNIFAAPNIVITGLKRILELNEVY